jgi:FKBP-type peptidyl-prolyl cis-trans isomerase
VATSRRRERELARRRFERRRQAEMERRARAKKRNTVIGATLGTLVVLGAVIGLVIGLSGGSGSKTAAKTRVNTIGPSSSTTPAAQNQPAPKKCAKIAPNPPATGQPTVPDVTGKAPTKLVTKDVKKGHGPAVKKGGSLSVDYIGISCATGKVFDATYKDGGKPFNVSPLGQASVIPGWNEGLVGMRAGGVRELVIPAALAYGSAPPGQAPTFPNDTLIFLVTAKSVKA